MAFTNNTITNNIKLKYKQIFKCVNKEPAIRCKIHKVF